MWLYFKDDNQLMNVDNLVEIKKETFKEYNGSKTYIICFYSGWDGRNLISKVYKTETERDLYFELIKRALIVHMENPSRTYYEIKLPETEQ